ncbi:helix-turn-helix transcriptional regulator [Streptomyces lincolnensis]|uniref:winged helix-turn-helix transcriptional regulator n=1 Tax=Streptomyces lincolnensis TaxID=1915 RepID=UPI001E3E21AC|nr:helix-turn-helix domain-containing protein [Streptomyces lincolnensis]MCD7444500.1 helix-turn-helix transcriptional regulator [Streptomyces lincolnensis]
MPTMTAAQRREQARTEYDAFIKACPTHQLLGRISEKWACLTLAALSSGTLRYSDLARTLAGVSPKMLTQTLRSLERDGLVSRTVTPSVPVRVDYALTDLGHSLAEMMKAVKNWAETHIMEVHEARERYDTEGAVAEAGAGAGVHETGARAGAQK